MNTKRLVKVELLEARNLTAMVKNGTSDTYAKAFLTDFGGREIKKEVFQTKIKAGTLAPQWKETFEFGELKKKKIFWTEKVAPTWTR